MKQRCYYRKAKYFKNYGGRGIQVCDEWRDDFVAFSKWALLNGYTDELSIDRIDNNSHYSATNCKWSTNIEQQNNKRDNVRIEFRGKTKTASQWSK
jgi:hypothetical protein